MDNIIIFVFVFVNLSFPFLPLSFPLSFPFLPPSFSPFFPPQKKTNSSKPSSLTQEEQHKKNASNNNQKQNQEETSSNTSPPPHPQNQNTNIQLQTKTKQLTLQKPILQNQFSKTNSSKPILQKLMLQNHLLSHKKNSTKRMPRTIIRNRTKKRPPQTPLLPLVPKTKTPIYNCKQKQNNSHFKNQFFKTNASKPSSLSQEEQHKENA